MRLNDPTRSSAHTEDVRTPCEFFTSQSRHNYGFSSQMQSLFCTSIGPAFLRSWHCVIHLDLRFDGVFAAFKRLLDITPSVAVPPCDSYVRRLRHLETKCVCLKLRSMIHDVARQLISCVSDLICVYC